MARNERLFSAMQNLGIFLTRELQKKIVQKGKVSTGRGLNSIATSVTEFLNQTILTETHEDYMTFVDRGRPKGTTKVPVGKLEEWLRQRNFSWAAGNIRGSAFSVQTNIFKFGIKPSIWLTETLEEQDTTIDKIINDASIEQADIFITNLVKRAGAFFTKSGAGVTITLT